ncbi:MAG: TetR/AcrR family transcriptional regulator [Pseudaminobacter sp.]|nr:TetR/AcrR family transcriptional regulator [Pseudaminobacter sp.]
MSKTTPISAQARRDRQKAELRAELLAAAHALVKEEGYEGLTIRKLAKRVGYAPMSVYSYFADKHAILHAIADDAFETLARRLERQAPDEPLAALRKLMTEYAAFGLENPNEYRTVFMTDDHTHYPENKVAEPEKQNPALLLLLRRVQDCVDAGVFQGDVHAIATMVWTVGHGTVSLLITFPDYPFGDRDKYIEMSMDFALAGLKAAPLGPLTPAEGCC